MALTFSENRHFIPVRGGWKCGVVDITFDDNYPTGGETVTAADLGVGVLYNLQLPGAIVAGGVGFVPTWNPTTGKIVVYESGVADAGLGELNGASPALNGQTVRCHYLAYA
jgi:hypothetical protein